MEKSTISILAITFVVFIVLLFWGCGDITTEEPTTKTGQAETTTESETKPAYFLYYDVPLEIYLQEHIFRLCAEYEINPQIVIAMIAVESNYDAGALSEDYKSVGLMQIQEQWHRGRMTRLKCHNLYSPYMNVTVGIDYLAELKVLNSDIGFMLSAYNGGINYANEQALNGYNNNYVQNVLKTASELKLKGAVDDVLF